MPTYSLNFGNDIIIYGAGQLGRQFYERIKATFNVIAFFDMNSDNIPSIEGTPVLNPYESKCFEGKTVIICLHNALFHVEVAERLNKHGFKQIIFIPAETQYFNIQAKNKMEQVYTAITVNDLFHNQIPEYSTLTQLTPNETVIAEYATSVATLVNVELLYVGSEKQPDQISQRNSPQCSDSYKIAYDMFMSYANKPIISLMPYVKFFTSMLNGDSDLDDYYRMCKAIQNKEHITDEDFIKDRYQVYALLEQKFARGIQNFYNSPVQVEWNQKGYFDVVDGFHRAVFLFCKGQKHIPVIMSKSDFEKWNSINQAKQVTDFFEKNEIRSFVTPIPSPHYRHFPYKREFANRNLIVQIMQFLDTTRLENLKFIDLSDYCSYFARHFYRMGVKKSTGIEILPENRYVSQKINCLLGLSGVECLCVQDRYAFEEVYDITIISESLSAVNQNSICQKINNNITQLVFWEFDPASDTKKTVTNTSKFKYYRKLGNIFNEGIYHEFGVFSSSIDLSK